MMTSVTGMTHIYGQTKKNVKFKFVTREHLLYFGTSWLKNFLQILLKLKNIHKSLR